MRKIVLHLMVQLSLIAAVGCAAGTEASLTETGDAELLPPAPPPAGAFASREENPYFVQYPKAIENCTELMSDASATSRAAMLLFQKRYRSDLAILKKDIEATGAQMVLLIISPESIQGTPVPEKKAMDFIGASARQLAIPLIDMHPFLQQYTAKTITQFPKDGHWSASGALILAKELAHRFVPYVQTQRKVITYAKRPALLNDLEADIDEVRDGGKDLPYHLVTNSQGIRATPVLTFPRKKPRLLILGDSEMFSPFLDDEQTLCVQLQKAIPQAEIVNASNIGYTLEDYISLFNEKAKYAEADVVVVATHAEDLVNYFFVQRNRMARSQKGYAPEELEKNLYKNLFGM